ncbi:MAG: carboxymuconolactone decarboxylase family protein [Gammaproteobacteria bacterium]|nr:carboxymuconolactone decarboxylase family protein [Gammaproteobacteria bacterium]MBQ0840333.1 carboxymuconolactone decarboxylase family protein [Gammaproteobacteria bacterium]
MRLNTPRIPPVEPENWTEEQIQALGMDIKDLQASIGSPDKVFNIVKTLIRYPALFKAWLGFANHVLFDSSLTPRDREIVILRIGWLCQSGYEFGQHIIIGRDAGLNDAEMKAIAAGADAANWSAAEQTLLKATDELHADAFIGNATFSQLQEHFEEQQILDLIFAVGQYNMVSMALNSTGVQLDEGIPEYKAFVGE